MSYTLAGSSQVYNTTRVYIPVSFQTTWNESSMFVVFGGFDTTITPNSSSNSIQRQPTTSSMISTGTSNSPASSTSSRASNSNSPKNMTTLVIQVAVVLAANRSWNSDSPEAKEVPDFRAHI